MSENLDPIITGTMTVIKPDGTRITQEVELDEFTKKRILEMNKEHTDA